jgi:CheY-like chemotaxis protein
MAMFGNKKSKPSEGTELVLAYLEEAQRVKARLSILDSKGREVPAHLTSVSEDGVSLTPQGSIQAEKGGEISLVFILDGLRFKAAGRLVEAKPGTTTMTLPGSIALAERRKRPRARLNAREGATVTALTGLFDGTGINGAIENISEGGFCVRVDKAMDVKTQRKMHLGGNLFSIGQPLMLVKLSKLPKCPVLELEGVVAYVDASQGMLVGIAFEAGKESLLGPVRSLVASRAGAIPTSVPPKSRRQEPRSEDEEEAAPVRLAEPPKQVEPTAVAKAPAPAPEVPVVMEEPPVPVLDERAKALLRMKRRAKGILLAMPEGPGSQAVSAFLQSEGYGRVMVATTLTDLLAYMEQPFHLILVDDGVEELKGLSLASFIQQLPIDHKPPLVLAEQLVDTELVLGAREAEVAQILIKPYDLDAEFRQMIEGHLGIG